ncbi:glutamate synthase large subunit [Effusibacillus lacus]|uniref:Glutamate synthase subunit alpha n=1 Tax=Effusibacillus lacus TaxID=1348429 RepID=A0A292YLW0_9BACL|nr:glutamate synthase large subunit [Effusibacillus lacus]TCS72505.1 glutamate synthase (NADPH/NADH) large chain [Effusibacillus lacus]GAX90928.1 glutamate synthase subunit alpha [Effusibacillus lacus]
MTRTGLPGPQGLYHPSFEHDACGIGFIANLKGDASNTIVKQGLEMLCNLEHRGGQGADPETGDGAGILVQVPHAYFKLDCKEQGIDLPAPGRYGVAMLFLPQDGAQRAEYEQKLEDLTREEGQVFLGWRTVPVRPEKIGSTARESQPYIRQAFIGAGDHVKNTMAFERKLYVIRKRLEKAAGKDLYVASMSSRTIVYKGLLTPEQLGAFYQDLQHPEFASVFSVVHSRFSTNTFPSWERAHPNRYLIHNGEINTLQGNINWMFAREKLFVSDAFGEDIQKVVPIIDMDGSDSAILDNCFEFFSLAGRSLPHVAMMMIPEPWDKDAGMSDPKKAFYEYHSCLMEPWDGPTAISFTDGRQIGAILDRNGLRPARYYVTSDDMVIFSSEVGVLDVPEEKVVYKGRLSPGRMLLVDLEEGRIISDSEIKERVASEHPYREWLNQNLIPIENLPNSHNEIPSEEESLLRLQKAHGYTQEELTKMLAAMVTEGKDPVGSMGIDMPLAVLSDRPQLLYNYFKQSFAQVTNPPIDALREECVTSATTTLGSEGNLLHPDGSNCRRIRLELPLITDADLAKLRHNGYSEFRAKTLPILFQAAKGETELEKSLEALFAKADQAIREGYSLLILSDRGINKEWASIPALLAVSGLHHHLVRQGTRTRVSLVIETGEARDVHQFAMLIGYGADAINPYLAMASLKELMDTGILSGGSHSEVVETYLRVATEGVIKVMSKMGISTVQSYRGAQIFEAVGISQSVIDKYFTRTSSQIGGIGLEIIARETLMRHEQAFGDGAEEKGLETGSDFQFRKDGEYHTFNPKTVHALQKACRENDYDQFKQYSQMANEERFAFLRHLLEFESDRKPIPIEEVEPVESIVKRFKTGAMSYGSLSREAHETLAVAMNRLGGKSNSGEGGEDPNRYILDENGDSRRSSIKQVASGRFGVTSHYLVNADELQIKMAQGAKPGEGGQLPGNKVYPWIAEVRGSTPGVGLISPPPHHDIYSIEDLAQLIHDLKNANPAARISVKLVSKAGVGTIAAGVAKGLADVIVISGHDGGTGASPKSSIKHAGLPWELGLAETHQTLLLNRLRDRVILETDGKMMTGRDVVAAALLGAEEYGFATAPLISIGCVMARVCHTDTCPVGVATQNPDLRKRFKGDPEHAENFMRFVAQEVREILSQLGYRSLQELIGRSDLLKLGEKAKSHWKAQYLDLAPLLYQPDVPAEVGRYFQRPQDHKLEQAMDIQVLLKLCEPALKEKKPVKTTLPIRNTNRVTGTILGSEVTKRYGAEGLPEDTIQLHFKGSAGQSFGAFVPKGITLLLEGDANDYVGKGLSGGKIAVYPSEESTFVPEENIIIGNVAFYGATAGEAYIRGMAGERFCVRNSGVHAVVEGVGDHGCEYMTGGRVVILGPVGKNFAAGMSGGVAYVYVEDARAFANLCNQEMVHLEALTDETDLAEVRNLIEKHVHYTSSLHAQEILDNWQDSSKKFIKVIPKDYKRMIESIQELLETGMSPEEAVLASFENSKKKGSKDTGKKVPQTLAP